MVLAFMSEPQDGDTKEGANGADPGESRDDGAVDAGAESARTRSDAPPASKEPDPLQAAKDEAQKYRDQLLRTAADFDNFRKRSRRDQEDAARKSKETTVKELLPVFDNLERALQSSEKAPDVKAVVEGLKLVMRQFTQSLEKMGIKRVNTVGHPFDPMLHEAIQHVESAEHPAGVVAIEVQAGYQLAESLVRAALVAVSKGPPEGAAASPDDDPTDPPS